MLRDMLRDIARSITHDIVLAKGFSMLCSILRDTLSP